MQPINKRVPRVWDKMLAGSISVLSFIGAGIVMTCIRSAIDLSNHELLLKTLSRVGIEWKKMKNDRYNKRYL